MDDDDPEGSDGAELVMPFVACRSNGGPFDDSAFVAGAEFEAIHRDLRALVGLTTLVPVTVRLQKYVDPRLLPQLDLVAMRCGFTMQSEPWDEYPDEWHLATFEWNGGDDA
jgi:hypothetical protein